MSGSTTKKQQEFNDKIVDLAKRAKLDSWNSFVRELPLPTEIMPALMTGRPELLKIIQPRAMTAEEVDSLFKLIAGLIETNFALKQHAEQVNELVKQFADMYFGAHNSIRKIEQFANFRHEEIVIDSEQEALDN